MDPQIGTALIGFVGGIAAGVLTWAGARGQSRAAVQSVLLEVRAQRLDGLWQMRRTAHAHFLVRVENVHIALRRVRRAAAFLEPENDATADACSRARATLDEAKTDLQHGLSLLRLSVGSIEANSAESLVSVLRGVITEGDEWIRACLDCRSDAEQRREIFDRSLGDVGRRVEHYVEMAKGYLHGVPNLAPSTPSTWQRLREWRLERRLRSLDLEGSTADD
ncbi:hypothetical protein ACFQ6V_09105 [Streptomyces roseifaciens]